MEAARQALLDGRLSDAEAGFRQALFGTDAADALHGLGLVCFSRDDVAAALPLLQAAHTLQPSGRTAFNLALALGRAGQGKEAEALLWWAVEQHPDYMPSWFRLAERLTDRGDPSEAVGVLARFADRATRAGDSAALTAAIERMDAIDADSPALLRLGNLLRMAGRNDLSRTVLDIRLRAVPRDVGAALSRALCHLTTVNESEADIEASRARYAAALDAVADTAAAATAEELRAGAAALGLANPFLLPYHGRNDRDLQRRYGRIAGRMVSADPWPAAPVPPAPRAGERIRVGFASAWMHLHSVAKTFAGWIEHLDRSRFAVYGYQFSDARDAISDRIEAGCDGFVRGIGDVPAWRERILAHAPHVLVYLDVGMEQTAPRLAARRLAPVQCVTWGHPETTGLETMDYFLSSELMEPPDGDDHYSEKLVRLPGLSICYEPLPSAGGLLDRAALGLRDDAVVYLSCQSLFKYRPAYDDVFPRIAERVPNARFLFLAQSGMAGDAAFRGRLHDAFARRGLDWQRFCVLTPPVEPAAFPSLLRCADVFLDSIGWSGCNTTLEAITCDLPVVTMPSGTMRGNHSAAILTAMGLRDWVAGSVEVYVDLAARLARADERAGLAALIRARRDRLFRDMRPIRALETFLHDAVMRTYTDANRASP